MEPTPSRGGSSAPVPAAHSIRGIVFNETRRRIMKYGARNQLAGKVTEIKRGVVMGQVKLEIPAGSKMGSVLTLDSIDELGLKVGDTVKVIVKAVNVLLVKEG
jgi:molybdopterin-binding protein